MGLGGSAARRGRVVGAIRTGRLIRFVPCPRADGKGDTDRDVVVRRAVYGFL